MTVDSSKIMSLVSPTGSVALFSGSSAPSGWLLCDGTSYATATYSSLHGVIGYTYGGSGANFNVPDLRDKFAIGKSGSTSLAQTNKGVTAAASPDASGNISADHTHSATTGNVSADHTHSMTKNLSTTKTSGTESADHSHSATTVGSSVGHTHSMSSHTHATPDLVLNYIIKA